MRFIHPERAVPVLTVGGCQVRVLVNFYCGKLEDTENIIPALKGLIPLTSMPAFASTDAIEVVRAYVLHLYAFAHVHGDVLRS